jgi:hypothetical protein
MSWSDKYKRSIDCDNPSGFSQKAHCAARKKRAKGETTKSKSPFNEMHQVKSHKTVEQIAKKHRLDVSFVKKQLEMGIPIEHEHTNDKDLATDIALQHLDEIPDYYTRLKKMESDAKKHHKKFKDVKEHCGCEDNAVQELETGLKKLDNTSYNSIDHLMRRIMKKHDMTAKQLHNAFVEKHDKTPDDWIKKLNEGTLHHWFKGSKSKDGKPGWVQADGSPCANEPGETKTPKCFSSGRLKALKRKGKKGLALIKSAVRRKRKKDKGQQAKFGGAKPTMVSTFAKGKKDPNYVKAEPGIRESMELNEASKDRPGKGSGTKDACYNKVKSRYDVWPSAYASGALVKCRKVGAANWGTKSEATEMIRYCPKCQKNETRSECKYGSKFWDMYSLPSALGKDYDPNKPHPGNFPESYDHEYSMARSELSTIISAAKRLRNKMKKGEGNIEAWVQSKITKAADYIDSAADYVGSGEMKEQVADTDTMSDKKPFDVAVKKIMNRKEKMTPTQRIIALRQAGKLQGVDEQMLPPINPESHKAAQRTQKLYNKGSRTDNPNEKEIFLKRTGPQLPLAKRKTETQVAHYEPEGEQIDESPAALALRAGLAAGTALTGMTLAKKAQQVGKKIEARNQETQKVIDSLKNSYELESEVIDEKCWPGYKKKGMKTMFGKRYPNRIKAEGFSNWRADFGLSEDWQKVNRQDKTDGLSQKAVNAYRRENPGSKLQTAVTEKNPEGKRAKRRASFCRRMSGMKSKLTSTKTARDPDSRINKALRRWNCN